MFNISESQKKVLGIWAIIAVIVLCLVILIAVSIKREDKELIENITAKNSKMLIDRNRYYTVKNAITKYYSFVNMKDYDAVLKILDENYKSKNNITEENIDEFITNDIQVSYHSKVMCLKSAKKGIYTFVTEGSEISANKGEFIKDQYYQVKLDGNSSLFSILPIDKTIYDEVCNEKV